MALLTQNLNNSLFLSVTSARFPFRGLLARTKVSCRIAVCFFCFCAIPCVKPKFEIEISHVLRWIEITWNDQTTCLYEIYRSMFFPHTTRMYRLYDSSIKFHEILQSVFGQNWLTVLSVYMSISASTHFRGPLVIDMRPIWDQKFRVCSVQIAEVSPIGFDQHLEITSGIDHIALGFKPNLQSGTTSWQPNMFSVRLDCSNHYITTDHIPKSELLTLCNTDRCTANTNDRFYGIYYYQSIDLADTSCTIAPDSYDSM